MNLVHVGGSVVSSGQWPVICAIMDVNKKLLYQGRVVLVVLVLPEGHLPGKMIIMAACPYFAISRVPTVPGLAIHWAL